jgi:intraflagellar transport protein 88
MIVICKKYNFPPGLHTILCYFAMGDKEKMKESFLNLLEIPLSSDEEKYNPAVNKFNYSLE